LSFDHHSGEDTRRQSDQCEPVPVSQRRLCLG
jgi:hypothetical protein